MIRRLLGQRYHTPVETAAWVYAAVAFHWHGWLAWTGIPAVGLAALLAGIFAPRGKRERPAVPEESE